jgi:hypothetical protein
VHASIGIAPLAADAAPQTAADLLRKVRRLEIRSRHLVEDLFSGQAESILKGLPKAKK